MPLTTATLYDKLGGARVIKLVVEEFYLRILQDPDVRGFFTNTAMIDQIRKQVEFMSAGLGAPLEYTARSMKEAHEGLGITDFHFDRVVEHLVDTFRCVGVDQADIDEVLTVLAPLKDDIVTV